MKDVEKFRNLIEFLAKEHPSVNHTNDKPHFASTLDAAENSYARTMHYPCVALDMGDMRINSAPLVERSIIIMFADHVKDTGNNTQKEKAFDLTCDIAIDFLSQLENIAELHPEQTFLTRVELDGTELLRVELEEAGLYGWMVQMNHNFSLTKVVCENHFGQYFNDKVDEYFSED